MHKTEGGLSSANTGVGIPEITRGAPTAEGRGGRSYRMIRELSMVTEDVLEKKAATVNRGS